MKSKVESHALFTNKLNLFAVSPMLILASECLRRAKTS